MLLHWLWELRYCILLIYYKIPTVLHYRGHQKKSGYKHFITRLHCNEHFNSINVRNSTSGQIKLLYLYSILRKKKRTVTFRNSLKCLAKYHRENEPEMFTDNKIYGNYRTGNYFLRIKKKEKKKSAKIGVAIPSNKTSIWCGLTSKKLSILSFVSWYIRFYRMSFLRPKAIWNLDRAVSETINIISTSIWKIIKIFSLIFQNSRISNPEFRPIRIRNYNTRSTSIWKIIKIFSLIFQNSRTNLSDSFFLFQTVVRNL